VCVVKRSRWKEFPAKPANVALMPALRCDVWPESNDMSELSEARLEGKHVVARSHGTTRPLVTDF